MRRTERSPQGTDSFCPALPMFLLSRNGRPLVSTNGVVKTAMGYSNREFAERAGRHFIRQGFRHMGVLSVSTDDRFQAVVEQLKRHQVTQLSWNDVGEPAVRTIIPLPGVPQT